ncbi:hypothetical protein BJX61DRAFT_540540 [Aspergillus egyptiacus]|nr:hypothetical protein BJX61DRAFT_540540 [Aspergillus egyptiacus]
MGTLPPHSHISRKKKEEEEEPEMDPGPALGRIEGHSESTSVTMTSEVADSNHQLIPASLLHESKVEISSLRQRISHLQRDLQEAQDFVFSLQPRQQTLTETEASEEFRALCAAVEDWVDQKLGDNLEEMTINPDCRIEDIANLMDLISARGKLAFHVPGSDAQNIQALILRYLADNLFNLDFYCPLGTGQREFITSLERAMRDLTPKRAVSSRPGFAEHAAEQMCALADNITRLLHVFAPGIKRQDLAKSFHESIIRPAAALARKMNLSFHEYRLEWSPYHDTHATLGPGPDLAAVEKEKFAAYEFVDFNSRKTLREMPGSDVEVWWMFDLTPRLVVRKLSVDSWGYGKTLVKPQILVSVSKAEQGQSNSEKTERDAARKDCSVNPTVLMWLERRLQEHIEHKRTSKSAKRIFGLW